MALTGMTGLLRMAVLCCGLGVAGLAAGPVQAQVTAFKQAVAEAAADDREIAAFYQAADYMPLWTTADASRRNALFAVLAEADVHGLPSARYDVATLTARLAAAQSARDRGLVEVELTRVFLQYARDMQTGALVPKRVDPDIVREVPTRDRLLTLATFVQSSPQAFLRALPPSTGEYARLLAAKMDMERQLASGGYGPAVPAASLKPGATGPAVAALRDRMVAMGHMDRSATQTYDAALQKAVQMFQIAHGLTPDGVAGEATMTEINRPLEARLQSVIVAMERERWLNMDRGDRHILVNITDFSAKIIDNDKVTFETRSVVGANTARQRTPEFSDVMDHMVINPSWNVPRSITVHEYLPMMKRNPNAVGHLQVLDSRGRVIPRSQINFAAYTERSFPFSMRQPPSDGNALGLVKFMFPNQYNIYLHDTPSKDLFNREVRAFSHGCIRLQQPFEFAYALLARQSTDPVGLFHTTLKTGRETTVRLENPVPVHLIYRTAFTDAKGGLHFRRDVYGRDAQIWAALDKAGVVLRAPGS